MFLTFSIDKWKFSISSCRVNCKSLQGTTARGVQAPKGSKLYDSNLRTVFFYFVRVVADSTTKRDLLRKRDIEFAFMGRKWEGSRYFQNGRIDMKRRIILGAQYQWKRLSTDE